MPRRPFNQKSSLSPLFRRVVDASGMNRYAICKALDMDQAFMNRFMTGKGGLSMKNLDALAGLLGLDIVAKRPRRQRGGTR